MRRRPWLLLACCLGCTSATAPAPEDATAPPAVLVERGGSASAAEAGADEAAAPTEAATTTSPELEDFVPATVGNPRCEVAVVELLEAEQYRGPGPMTPALDAQFAADPDFARFYQAESHGDQHIQCHYAVELSSHPKQRFRWREVRSNTLEEHTPAVCNGLAAEVAESILETTGDCLDLDAGAYWGYVLEPMP